MQAMELEQPVEAECPRRTATLLDLGHLQRYTLGDAALQREVLGLFRDQIESSLGLLEQSLISGDKSLWRMSLHTLKGSARAVGAFHLGAAAEAAERLDCDRDQRKEATCDVASAAAMTLSVLADELDR